MSDQDVVDARCSCWIGRGELGGADRHACPLHNEAVLAAKSQPDLAALDAEIEARHEAAYQKMLADIAAGEEKATKAELLSRLRQRGENFRVMMDDLAYKDEQLAATRAALQRAEQEIAQARKLLNPNCEQETLCGAIRSLQQAHLSEKGNAEAAEAEMEKLVVSFNGVVDGWKATAAELTAEREANNHFAVTMEHRALAAEARLAQMEAALKEHLQDVDGMMCVQGPQPCRKCRMGARVNEMLAALRERPPV